MTILLIISIAINIIVAIMCYFIFKEVCWLRDKTLDLNARILESDRVIADGSGKLIDTCQALVDKLKKYMDL